MDSILGIGKFIQMIEKQTELYDNKNYFCLQIITIIQSVKGQMVVTTLKIIEFLLH